jgi:septal ring factor EnvC (AmiA/AmiB activator)
MADYTRHLGPSGPAAPLPRMYSPDLKPHLQLLLSILADIDSEFEKERARISDSTKDLDQRIRLLEGLRQQHRSRRGSYLKQLALLQERIWRVCQ